MDIRARMGKCTRRASGTLAERRDVLRGLVRQIAYDPETGEAVGTFFGLPRVRSDEGRARLMPMSSSALMAGARHLLSKRTLRVTGWQAA